ncbi:MFS transporter [Thiotrichales bacterium 19X7-9]|nr:MFS transporter [Thiotrichales bacterium 19X7-9]
MKLKYEQLGYKKRLLLGSLFFTLAGVFFLYEYFLRTSFGSMEILFRKDLAINASSVSLISSAYYLAYAIMQIPVGFLVDRFGVRRVGAVAIIICSVGCFLFSLSDSFTTAWWGRFAIGFGSAFAFVMMLKIALDWFPHRIFGAMAGMTQLLGSIGPILAGAPFAYLLTTMDNDWRVIFHFIALAGVILGVIFILFVRDSTKVDTIKQIQRDKTTNKKASVFKQVKLLLSYRQLWIVAAYVFFSYASIELLGSLFGASLMIHHGYSREAATGMVSLLWVGLALGSPAVGLLSDLIKRRKIVLTVCSLVGLIAITLILWVPYLNAFLYSVLFFVIGLATSSQSLSFTVVVERVPKSLEATAMGVNNMFVLLGAMVIQIIGGYLLQYFWLGKKTADNVPIYSLQGYTYAISISIVFFLISLIISIFMIKETYCKRIDKA